MTSQTATVIVDSRLTTGVIDDRIYGQFIENMGRAIYGGLVADGAVRDDVLEACRQLNPSVLRWPGGNFASGYHWRDGVGPVHERPSRFDLAWSTLESNEFGTEEFLDVARRLGATPYLNLNTGTGSIDEALEWLQYCNSELAVPEVGLRQGGPHPEPHNVPIWGVGNETFGWWQHGHTTATSYAEQAREWGKLLRWADPSISLVGVGAPDPDWNWTVLNDAGVVLDWLSLHFYWNRPGYAETTTGPIESEAEIREVWGLIHAAKRRQHLVHDLRICVDEWGVWTEPYLDMIEQPEVRNRRLRGEYGPPVMVEPSPMLEQNYDLKDALAHATWLHVMWRNPDKVSLATEAQMVNVIAPIHTTADGLVLETVFHPLAIGRANAGSVGLRVSTLTSCEVDAPGVAGGVLPAIDSAGTLDPKTGRIHLSLINRHETDAIDVTLEGVGGAATSTVLWHEDHGATNTIDQPTNVAPIVSQIGVDQPLRLPPHSHTTLVFR